MSVPGQSLISDLRYAVRQLRRAPGFALTAILTLAIGIGANAAVFSVVDTVLLRPLGYRDADGIFALDTRLVKESRIHTSIGGDDFVDAANQVHALEAAAYYSGGEGGIQVNGQGEYLTAATVSRQFGQVLGITPAAGRLFLQTGDVTPEALVSSGFARQHFGSAQAAIGHVIGSSGEPHIIVGVLPDGFSFPQGTTVWLGGPDRPQWPARSAYNQRAIIRLSEKSNPAELAAELQNLSGRLAAAYPEDREKALVAVPLQEQLVGGVRPMLHLLVAAVTVILLIVCANITHLQLVRSTTQSQRVALLNALGASRTRLARLALAQSAVIAMCGGAAGILLGLPLTKLLLRLAPTDLPRIAELRQTGIALNSHVVAVCFLISTTLMLLTAVLPVWRSWHVDPASALKQDASRGMAGGSGTRLRSALMVGEVALTFVLCIGSALLVQQMQKLSHADLGFQADRLLLADIHAPSHEDDGVNHVLRLNTLLEQLRATPGVSGAAAVMGAPSQSPVDVKYAVQGRTKFEPGASLPIANVVPVSPEYLKLMGISLLRGRDLGAADIAGMPYVAVINRSMQRQSFADRDPIGQELFFGFDENTKGTRIVGVAEDAIQESPNTKPAPTFYVAIAQHPRAATDVQLLLRTAADPHIMLDTVAQRIRAFDPSIAVTTATMRDSLSDSLRTERFRSTLFSSFALISIVLAAVGMYGVTSYAVAQRRFEFALRFAFGARKPQIFGGVIRNAIVLAAAGLLLGGLAALALTRIVASLLTGVTLLTLTPWLAAAAAVFVLMTAATLLPARRAAGVEPIQALRTE